MASRLDIENDLEVVTPHSGGIAPCDSCSDAEFHGGTIRFSLYLLRDAGSRCADMLLRYWQSSTGTQHRDLSWDGGMSFGESEAGVDS